MTGPTWSAAIRFEAQNSARSRGDLVVVPGRGESPRLYERLGARIAYDGYTVTILAVPSVLIIDEEWFGSESVSDLAWGPGPLTLLGSDSGAVIATLLAEPLRASGLVLAGIGGLEPAPEMLGTADPLVQRSACPVYRERVRTTGADLGAQGREAFSSAITERFLDARIQVPLLAIHGDSDPITPLGDALRLASLLHAEPQTVVVHGGLHDILNDVSHRSTSAEIVQFLERRSGPVLLRGAPVEQAA